MGVTNFKPTVAEIEKPKVAPASGPEPAPLRKRRKVKLAVQAVRPVLRWGCWWELPF